MALLLSLLPSNDALKAAARRVVGLAATLVLAACATGPSDRSEEGKARPRAAVDAFATRGLCFTYLEDPLSRDRKNWDDLLYRTDTVPLAKHVVRFQLRKDGYGDDVNMDYYALTFDAPPNVTVEAFFAQMRKDFPIFAAWKDGRNVFQAYDPGRSENEEKWKNADHTGALMTFQLFGLGFSNGSGTGGGSNFLVTLQYGDVQTTCSSPTDFVFATVQTDHGTHPVSGHRGFGLKEDSGKKTWTFYSKAVDRLSNTTINKAHVNGVPLAPDVYVEGRRFWSGFYAKMAERLNAKGLNVKGSVSENCNLAKWERAEFRKCDPL